jgi:hypothetical protein
LRVGDTVDQVDERAGGGSAPSDIKSKRENPAIYENTFSVFVTSQSQTNEPKA